MEQFRKEYKKADLREMLIGGHPDTFLTIGHPMRVTTELAGHPHQDYPAIMTRPEHLIIRRHVMQRDRLHQFTRDGGDLD